MQCQQRCDAEVDCFAFEVNSRQRGDNCRLWYVSVYDEGGCREIDEELVDRDGYFESEGCCRIEGWATAIAG